MKKLLSIAIAAIMLFALVACNNDDMQSKIDELEAQLQAQTDKIAELEQNIESLEQQLAQQKQEYEDAVIQLSAMQGEFYTVQEAYENGWLTREDVMHIFYFTSAGVRNDEQLDTNEGHIFEGTLEDKSTWQEIDFTPEAYPSPLDEMTDKIVRTAYSYGKTDPDSSFDVLTTTHYGTYDDCVAVTVRGAWDYSTEVIQQEVAGVIVEYSGAFPIVWKKEKGSIAKGLESGFKYDLGGCIDTSSFLSAYRSDRTEFDINDVTLDFYYGDYYPSGMRFVPQ